MAAGRSRPQIATGRHAPFDQRTTRLPNPPRPDEAAGIFRKRLGARTILSLIAFKPTGGVLSGPLEIPVGTGGSKPSGRWRAPVGVAGLCGSRNGGNSLSLSIFTALFRRGSGFMAHGLFGFGH